MPLADNLLAYWKLDESVSGRADSVGSKTLIDPLTVAVGSSAGVVGDAAVFPALANYHLVSYGELLTSVPFSFSFWFYTSAELSGQAVFVSQGEEGSTRDFEVRLHTENQEFAFATGYVNLAQLANPVFNSPAAEQWHHVVCTMSASGTMKAYLNGALTDQNTVDPNIFQGLEFTKFFVGNHPDNSSLDFDLRIDELGVWTRELSQSDVTELYNGGEGITYPFPTTSPPVAAFSATPLNGTAPLSVTFTDASTNTPTSWSWEKSDDAGASWSNFSSGATSQNPTEEFTAGTWSIRLTATNAGGSDSETKLSHIVVSSASRQSGTCVMLSFDEAEKLGLI